VQFVNFSIKTIVIHSKIIIFGIAAMSTSTASSGVVADAHCLTFMGYDC
jgi:hypothetical protein